MHAIKERWEGNNTLSPTGGGQKILFRGIFQGNYRIVTTL